MIADSVETFYEDSHVWRVLVSIPYDKVSSQFPQAYPTSYGGFGSSLLSTLPHAPLNMWSGMGGEAQQQPLIYPQPDYQQQVGRRGSGRGRGGRTPGRGRGRGRGGGGGRSRAAAAAYGDGSSDFSLDGSEAEEEAMTEDEDDEWTGSKAKSVSKRGRAR